MLQCIPLFLPSIIKFWKMNIMKNYLYIQNTYAIMNDDGAVF